MTYRAKGGKEGYPGEDKDTDLKIQDLVNYIASLSRLHNNAKTGNLELSQALRKLATALRTQGSRPVTHLPEIIGGRTKPGKVNSPSKPVGPLLPDNLGVISHAAVEKMLSDPAYSKTQLMEVGIRRFGISPSKLARSNRRSVLETIQAALDHERSIGIISDEARRGGARRSP